MENNNHRYKKKIRIDNFCYPVMKVLEENKIPKIKLIYLLEKATQNFKMRIALTCKLSR